MKTVILERFCLLHSPYVSLNVQIEQKSSNEQKKLLPTRNSI